MPNITLEAADVWRKIQKQALTKRIDIVEMETDGTDISTPFQASIQSMSAIEALEPVLISSSLPNPTSSQPLHNISPANADCKAVADHINAVLPLNTLQRLVVEGVLDHVIRNKGRLCVTREDQLLLYVRGEGGVGKSRVIHALEMGFTLLDRRNELMLSAPTGYAAEGIGGSTVHTALSISTRNIKSSSTNVSAIWTHQFLLIIDELSIIPLGLLATMDKQQRKARGAIVFSTALFGGLPLVILMGDFYQFAPVSGHALWDSPYSEDEIHGKVLWDNFRLVLFLTEQMRQRSDLAFQAMLKRARHSLLNVEDVNSLNARVATHLPDSDFADTIIIVQKNKTRHLINRLQAENFARSHNIDLILFPTEHSRNKKDGGNLIQHEDLLGIQEGEGNAAGPGILYYCKGMPAIVLANQCTPLGIVNGARVIIYGVVPHP
ncbi:AAA family ATPase [uncultured Nostoc sp.]|uniref:AAA family ATPase n=1 Tax=uncultured Nostoc sp. TaxID=340711 RepID=UPI0035C9FCB3